MSRKLTAVKKGHDLHDCLLAFTSNMLRVAGSLPEDRVGGHLSEQILRSATAAYFRHGESEGASTSALFVEKWRSCLEQLRLCRRALQLVEKAGLPCDGEAIRQGLRDVDYLIRVFWSSIKTLETK